MQITITRTRDLLTPALLLSAMMTLQPALAAEPVSGPWPDLKTRPIEVQWEYSTDGGKTFGAQPPAGAAPNADKGIAPMAFRGTFDVADPQGVASLFVRIVAEPQGLAGQSPAICTGDLVAASGGYWKDLGFCPTLLNAKATLNGKPVPTTFGPSSLSHSASAILVWIAAGRLKVAPLLSHLVAPADCATVYGEMVSNKDRYLGVVFDWSQVG